MAFLQPQQRPQAQRHASFSQPNPVSTEPVRQTAAVHNRHADDAQEWILFSPTVDDQQSTTTRTSQTPRTAAFSRLSDFDSLDTAARSDQYALEENDGSPTCQGTDLDDDETGELDSLDDGLHAFNAPLSPRLDTSGGTVLPMHDGLGTFPSSYAAQEGMQEHLWQFERYNPHRRRPQRRRSSVQKRLHAMEDEEEMRGLDKHEERRLRIEKWRLEQSRAVLEEIEKETRRRRRRMSLASGQTHSVTQSDVSVQDTPTSSNVEHNTTATAPVSIEDGGETETFWERITRRVIKDLMGLDETTLSVIFGEELAEESTPTQTSPLAPSASTSTLVSHSDITWEQRLLERIARELGLLANRISEHEGAFSTYNQAPQSLQAKPIPERTLPVQSSRSQRTSPVDEVSADDNLFAPTFPKTETSPPEETLPSLWGIEEEAPNKPTTLPSSTDDTQKESEYWERDLDVGVIFRYLRNRFSSRAPSPAQPPTQPARSANIPTSPLPPAWSSDPNASALGTSPESLRRADMIRRHHPLVSHAANMTATRRKESMLLRRQHQLLLHKRASSSCASQSTKRTRSGSSRRYWDFPAGAAGSAAGGSLVSVTSGGYEGMMGSWGEV